MAIQNSGFWWDEVEVNVFGTTGAKPAFGAIPLAFLPSLQHYHLPFGWIFLSFLF